MYKTIILFLFVLLIALTSCADTEKEPKDVKKQGEKGGICYNDGTCNEGLRCVNNICEEYIDPCLGIVCDNWEKCVEGICSIRSNRCERNSDCMGSEICDVNHNCVNPTSPCQNKSCSNHGVCVIENSTAKCNCNEGYDEDGLNCVPNSENICLNVTCDEWKDCNPTNGLCELKEGKCELTQDCEEGFICDITHTCFGVVSPCDNVICSNQGSCIVENDLPKCICNHGFEANDLNCEDINECELNIDNCLDNYTCENTVGSFICNEIIVDLCENITCDEWKECNSLNGQCETKENRCSNNGECLGTQICDENHNCVNPVDHCEGQSCSNLGVCAVINNTAKCFCDEGYISDGLNCIENTINLCENITCDEWKECNSSNGRCELKSGRCERTIECLVSEICNSNHTCIQQSSTCEGQSCSNHGICVIENNIAKCNCNEGFNADGLSCVDIDECELNNGTCSENAYCNNSYGGFYCQCKSGFLGDGITCIDVNECQNGIHNCSTGADCINTEGSFSCVCKEGYNGDGLVCEDIDECLNNTDNCNEITTCINTVGSFTCICNSGFIGNGIICVSTMDIYEVTVNEFNQCVKAGSCSSNNYRTNSQISNCNLNKVGSETHPMNCVTWTGATQYCAWKGKRLPTEEEWEFAARGGENYIYSGSNDPNSVAWYHDNSGNTTHSVGTKAANGYGLHDMSGNVWEWTNSWEWTDSSILRGGCFDSNINGILVNYRAYSSIFTNQFNNVGFRCIQD